MNNVFLGGPCQKLLVRVRVEPAESGVGSVTGSGIYIKGKTVIIEAVPAAGYVFTRWSDGSDEAVRRFKAQKDVTLIAEFCRDSQTGTITFWNGYEN